MAGKKPSIDIHSITIRPYRAGDVSTLIALFQESARSTGGRDYTASQVRAWAPDFIDPVQFARRSEARSTWVADCEQRVAGFSDLEPDGHIDMLFVHPDFQRRGVARALLAQLERCARNGRINRLYTEASITAKPVFEAVGFQVLAAQTVTLRTESLTNFLMEKGLVPSCRGVD